MVRHASLFSQLIALFSRKKFCEIIYRHGSERYAKGFHSWDHFVVMLFCQLAQAKSLREICSGLASCLGKLRHLGIKPAPNKSTLSYANAHRPWQMYRELFYQTLDFCKQAAPRRAKKFRFKNKLLTLDATTISLCLSLFPWAKFRRTKGAVKLHLLLDHDGYLPTYACITDGKKHEVKVAHKVSLAPGSIGVIDRGYTDYKLFADWSDNDIYFITRQKDNPNYQVLEKRPVPINRHILADELIVFTSHYAQRDCPYVLRRIVAEDKDTGDQIVFLTSHIDLGATTVAAIYKDRWQIELFFKALKQNLKVKTFEGLWTALIAMLLIKLLQFKSKFDWSLSNLVAFLRWNLFTYRNLWDWIDSPFE